jgi:hypothetical protein
MPIMNVPRAVERIIFLTTAFVKQKPGRFGTDAAAVAESVPYLQDLDNKIRIR